MKMTDLFLGWQRARKPAYDDCEVHIARNILHFTVALALCVGDACAEGESASKTRQAMQWIAADYVVEDAPASPQLSQITGSPESVRLQSWADGWQTKGVPDYWIQLATELIAKYRMSPPRAGRALAYLATAMNDGAVVAARQGLTIHAQQAAMHACAYRALAHFFPNESSGRFEALGTSALAALAFLYTPERPGLEKGALIGQQVHRAMVERATLDGADEVWDARQHPAPFPGMWRATPPMDTAHPQEPLAGQWKTWLSQDITKQWILKPPRADSPKWLEQAKEVLSVAKKLTTAQKQIALDWHLDQGTVTPPGLWNQRTIAMVRRAQFSPDSTAALFATLNVAMMDASIACWRTKYSAWIQRPITLIRDRLDPSFNPLLVTPMHPSYPSGHACVSGAAAEVLKHYLPQEARTVDAWAKEAALSRLYGGIHFRMDNEDGLKLGRLVGRSVLAAMKINLSMAGSTQGTATTTLR